MKSWLKVIFLVFLSLGAGKPALADIDQLCLRQCIAGGSGSTACMGTCSYGETTAPVVNKAPLSHNVFSPLTPLDDNTVLVQPKAKTEPLSKDYACINRCLQAGSVYQSCEKQCSQLQCASGSTATNCITGATSVPGVTGVLNGVPQK